TARSVQWHAAERDLPSFPTRRSSDLGAFPVRMAERFVVAYDADNVDRFERLAHHLKELETDRLERLAFLPRVRDVQREIAAVFRSEEHTSELQSRENLVCRLLLEKKK